MLTWHKATLSMGVLILISGFVFQEIALGCCGIVMIFVQSFEAWRWRKGHRVSSKTWKRFTGLYWPALVPIAIGIFVGSCLTWEPSNGLFVFMGIVAILLVSMLMWILMIRDEEDLVGEEE